MSEVQSALNGHKLYALTVNMPGYLPVCRPEYYETEAEAASEAEEMELPDDFEVDIWEEPVSITVLTGAYDTLKATAFGTSVCFELPPGTRVEQVSTDKLKQYIESVMMYLLDDLNE